MLHIINHRLPVSRRTLTSVFLLGVLLAPGCTNKLTEADLYGVWQTETDQLQFTFSFEPDHSCAVRFMDPESAQVTVWTGNCTTDFSKHPIPVSINNIPQLPHALHTIVSFESGDELIMAPFSPRRRLRPVSFHRRSIKLTRAEGER